MATSNTTSNYPCSQPVLYVVNDSIIANLRANLPAFADFRGVYSDKFCDVLATKNYNASILPNDQMRMLAHETCRTELVTLGKDCRSKWQRLKMYIEHAVPTDHQVSNWDAAGWELYDAASNESWAMLKEMMSMGSLYMSENLVQLKANHNMPDSFQASYETSREAFDLKYKQFLAAQDEAHMGTVAKINANNDVFAMIMSVCNDASMIYENDSVMRAQFTFSTVCNTVSPPGAAAADLQIVNAETNEPMIAEVKVQGTSKHAETNDPIGKCSFTQLASGETVFVVTADGFTAQNVIEQLSPGSTRRIMVQMVPMLAGMQQRMPVPENGITEIAGVSPQSSVSSAQPTGVSG